MGLKSKGRSRKGKKKLRMYFLCAIVTKKGVHFEICNEWSRSIGVYGRGSEDKSEE